MEEIKRIIGGSWGMNLTNVSDGVIWAMIIVVGLIAVLSVFAAIISIMLAIKYIKYNRRQNSFSMTGEQIARRNLDRNGLQHIQVSKNGSILFGNSYSHYFKKVRLRRLTWQKTSVSSMAMAYQKSELAVLDKTGDKDMKKRIFFTPIIYSGPLAFIPLVLIGILLDIFVFNGNIFPEANGTVTIVFCAIGLVFYLISFVMSLLILKTELKAQKAALVQMQADGASANDIEDSKKLFKLYNIEYVNNMIIALLEMLYRVLQLVMYIQGGSSGDSSGK